MSQALREPVFPETEVSRHIRTRLAEIDHERALPGQRAALAFIATYFDEAERASRPSAGTPASVAAITREELVAFHAAQVVPSGSTIVVAGDLTGVDVLHEVEQAFGAWSGEPAAPLQPVAPRRADDAARIVFVDRPGSVQTELYLGCPGPDRRVEGGWAPFPVLAFVMGGSPNARIDAVLREDKGYTYGIRATFRPRRREGLFLTSAARCARTPRSRGSGCCSTSSTAAATGSPRRRPGPGSTSSSKTAPGRYATADAVADEASTMALEGLSTEFTTANLLDLATVDGRAALGGVPPVRDRRLDRGRGRRRRALCRRGARPRPRRRERRPRLSCKHATRPACPPGQAGLVTVRRGGSGAGGHHRVLEYLQALEQQLVADRQRRQEPEDVALGAAGEDHDALLVAGRRHGLAVSRRRARWCRASHQLDRHHRPAAADVADRAAWSAAISRSRSDGQRLDPLRGARSRSVRAASPRSRASAAAQATGLPPYVPPRPPACDGVHHLGAAGDARRAAARRRCPWRW